jgi:hypothetical protein
MFERVMVVFHLWKELKVSRWRAAALWHRLSSGVNLDEGMHLGVERRECQLAGSEGSRLSEDRNQTGGIQRPGRRSWHLQKPMPLLC